MNSLERRIYNLVRFSPNLKNGIVKIYQFLLSIIPQKRAKSDYKIITREGYFFGFHDKCPWSAENKNLLAHKIKIDIKMPNANDEVEIGIFKGENFDDFIPLSTTKAWNWQMGSMLQWVGDTDHILFNDFDGVKHFAKTIDLSGKVIKKYDKPIAAISPNGKFGLSHSFVRLKKVAPAYGYANGEEDTAFDYSPANDGIYFTDLNTGKCDLIFSLRQFKNLDDFPKDAYHYFTHCLFSPNNRRFAFYHRWVEKNGQTWTKLFTSDLQGEDIHYFDFSGVVTHMSWYNNDQLLTYGLKKEVGDHYYLLKDETNEYSIIGENDFKSDGHPQVQMNNYRFITDTYPDRLRRQFLIQYDMKTNTLNNIAIMRSPLKFSGDIRCDLHPRWDRKGDYICFDSAHSGTRSLCTIKLK